MGSSPFAGQLLNAYLLYDSIDDSLTYLLALTGNPGAIEQLAIMASLGPLDGPNFAMALLAGSGRALRRGLAFAVDDLGMGGGAAARGPKVIVDHGAGADGLNAIAMKNENPSARVIATETDEMGFFRLLQLRLRGRPDIEVVKDTRSLEPGSADQIWAVAPNPRYQLATVDDTVPVLKSGGMLHIGGAWLIRFCMAAHLYCHASR
ncbi:MAG: hypothetical protein JXB30_07875 [Anaerolineae bacterium]|nr:hypothetical protein [Anaerolineae bacterium]